MIYDMTKAAVGSELCKQLRSHADGGNQNGEDYTVTIFKLKQTSSLVSSTVEACRVSIIRVKSA